jgi:hypothetical protein
MKITDAQLQGLALQALNMAKRELERSDFNCLLASYHEGESLHRMKSIERMLIEKLGKKWLSGGHTKDLGFGLFKLVTAMLPPDAMVFVSIVNFFEPTERLLALSLEEQHKILGQTHDGHHQAVKEGLLKLCDAMTPLAQTPDRVCQYVQKIESDRRGVRFLDQPAVHLFDQSDFDGRMKLFGAKIEDYEFILKNGYRQ